MKTKIILTVTLAAVLGSGLMWFATNHAMAADAAPASQKIAYYTCPMHPSVKADKPGDCSICGMHLVPVYASNTSTNATSASAETKTPAMMSGCCSSGMSH